MKKKNGFTLIEVLGTLIVLSVIATITIPIVTGAMKSARKSSFEVSAKNLIKAADHYYADHQLEIKKTIVFDFDTREGKNEEGEELSFKGTKPDGGRIIIAMDGEVTLQDVTNGDYYANSDSTAGEDVVITETNQVMTRDELTDAIKELQEELKKKADQSELDKTNTQLDSTTTIANTANTTVNGLNNNFLNKTYPVGSVYVSNKNVNPGTIFGGTWVAFGSGRTLVGVDGSDTNYNTVEKTGGSNSQNITLTTSNLPSHTHTFSGTTSSNGDHSHWVQYRGNNLSTDTGATWLMMGWRGTFSSNASLNTATGGAHTHTFSGTTSSVGKSTVFSVSHIQPYITVYMWKGTA